MKILIVGADRNNVDRLGGLLEASGYEVASARNGAEALEKLRTDGFEMIISDILMPVMDGLQLCHECKTDDKLKRIPFVFYTGTYVDEKDEQLALKVGADKFIRKPIEVDEFMNIIQGIVRDVEAGRFELARRKPRAAEGKALFKLYSERLMSKLEKKLVELRREIVRREQLEKELREAREKYRVIAENTSDVIFTTDMKLRFSFVSPSVKYLLGWTAEEVMSMKLKELLTPSSFDLAIRILREEREIARTQPRDAARARTLELELIRKDGSTAWAEARASFLWIEGRNVGIVGVVRDITERKKAQEVAKSREKYFEALLERSSDAVAVIDSLGIVRYQSPNYEAVWGRPSAGEISRDLFRDVHPDDRALVAEKFDYLLKNPQDTVKLDVRVQHTDGTWRILEMVGRNLLQDPLVQGIVVNFRDITLERRAAEDLKRSEERYRTVLDEMEEGYYETDLRGTFTFVSDAMTRILGYSRDELIGMNYKIYTPEEMVKPTFEAYNRVYRTGEPLKSFPSVKIRKDGSRIFVEESVFPIRNEKGEVIGFRGISRDVTERKQAADALQKSEERYRMLAENAGEAILVIQDGLIRFVNPRGAELSGYPVEELVSQPFIKLIHPDDRDVLAYRYAARLNGEAVPEVYEFRVVRKDGRIRWGELNAVVISWEDRPATLYFVRDITERKQAEEALRQSEERYRSILERMDDGYFEFDLSGNITFVNSSTCRFLGYSQKELIGMNYKRLTAEDYVDSIFQIFNQVYRTGMPNRGFRWKVIRKDGSYAFTDTSVAPLRNDKGEIIGFSGLGRDVTDRIVMEQQLLLTDRLASIGQLAAGIAHELNNPLTGVIGFSDLLLARDLPADVKEDLQTINEEAKRAVNIVKGLLAFAREQKFEKTLVDINSIIQGVLKLRSYEQKVSNIEVDASFAPDLPKVMGNGAQLQQVFINIILNAEQAMVEAHRRGKLTIVTECVGDMIRASITDDGPGISPENMRKLFMPFFTTKEVGKGTGLGLAICHGIVTEHGGRIYAESKLGSGATFVVELPAEK